MNNANHDNGGLYFMAYVIVGLPVAWLHMRRQRMIEAHKNLQNADPAGQSGLSGIVVFTLAVMWPLLLMAMGLNALQQRGKSKEDSKVDVKDENDKT